MNAQHDVTRLDPDYALCPACGYPALPWEECPCSEVELLAALRKSYPWWFRIVVSMSAFQAFVIGSAAGVVVAAVIGWVT